MSNSLWPHKQSPTRPLCPWNSPGKNTGVGCHFLLPGIFPTRTEPMFPALQVDSLPLRCLGSPYLVRWAFCCPLLWTTSYIIILENLPKPCSEASWWKRDSEIIVCLYQSILSLSLCIYAKQDDPASRDVIVIVTTIITMSAFTEQLLYART